MHLHDRRRNAITLVVGNDFNFAVLENANARIGRAQINADHRAVNYDTPEKQQMS